MNEVGDGEMLTPESRIHLGNVVNFFYTKTLYQAYWAFRLI